MLLTFILLVLLAPLVVSNDLTIYNFCGRTVYSWQQGREIKALPNVQNNTHIKTDLSPDPIIGGKNIILSFDPRGIDNGAPKIQLSYHAVHPDEEYELWYALSNLNGKMLEGKSLDMGVVGSPKCPRVEWKSGEGDMGVKVCQRFKFSDLRLCAVALKGKGVG
jgi:hypothetical protein